jgi:hypothetical protein
MSDTEGAALSEQMEDEAVRLPRRPARRPSFRYFGIRYSQFGGEYKGYCHLCGYESDYGSRGKTVKRMSQHVTDKHGLNGSEER